MEKERIMYIGCLNGVVLCVDRCSGQWIGGRVYCQYWEEPAGFQSLEKAFRDMETLFDRLNFPMRGTLPRRFGGRPERMKKGERMVRAVSDEELMRQHGDLGTFIIRVRYRQYNSWQGEAVWVEKGQKQNFRSALELLRMIDDAVEAEDEGTGLWDRKIPERVQGE